MLRKSIIMMALVTAFTLNSSAVQIEVQPDNHLCRGADASIPANAYENYRAGSSSNIGTSDVIKLDSKAEKHGEMFITDWGLTRDEVNEIASGSKR